MSANTVLVKNISPQVSEKEVKDFFSFCGKIENLSLSDGEASVSFEKATAAKTALLLDNTQLGSNLVQVSSAASADEPSTDRSTGAVDPSGDDLSQEDKPRSRIIAEYLAHGYTISDKAVERAIALDSQHGFSNRFTTALQQFDSKYNASGKAQELDQKYGVTDRAQAGWQGLASYFEHALGTPTGQRVRSYYMDTNKQVMDVHTEARRLADLKSGKSTTTQAPGTSMTNCSCHSETGKCGCTPGNCSCSDCPKNLGAQTSSQMPEKASMEMVSYVP